MKELEDYDWFPHMFRKYQTDYIGFVVANFGMYKPFIQYVNKQTPENYTMFDLCSGSGEPAISIFRESLAFSRLILSDKFPQTYESPAHDITYLPKSFDVIMNDFEPGKTYTMFNAFHHFSDRQKARIAERIGRTGSNGFIVEILQPTVLTCIKVLIATTIGTLLLAPFLKPFSLKRLFFTYIIPVNLLCIVYDGLVSVFKSRTIRQYQKILQPLEDNVTVFKIKNGLSPLIVIQIN